jgi:hypothetical protein
LKTVATAKKPTTTKKSTKTTKKVTTTKKATKTTKKAIITKKSTTTKRATATTAAALPTCLPTNAFSNGDFTHFNDGWSYVQPHSPDIPPTDLQFGLTNAIVDLNTKDGSDLMLDLRLNRASENFDTGLPKGDIRMITSFQTEIRMCPGVAYDLAFRHRVNKRANCALTLSVGERDILTLNDKKGWRDEWTDVGPVTIAPVKAGQSGVRQGVETSDLYVQFQGTLTCKVPTQHNVFTGHSWILPCWIFLLLGVFTATPRR